MRVCFRNDGKSRVYIAVALYDPAGCADDGKWATRGWYSLAPGEEGCAFDTSNRYYYYYAEFASGAKLSGDYGPMYVTKQAFQSCINLGTTSSYIVGLIERDLQGSALRGEDSLTVELSPTEP